MNNWRGVAGLLGKIKRLQNGELVYVTTHSGDCHYSALRVNEETGLVLQGEKRAGYVADFKEAPEYASAHVEMRVIL